MFLLASPTSTSSTLTGRRIHQDTCPRFRHSQGGLLQHGIRWCTEVCHNDRRLSQLLHDDLYWLDVADRVRFKLAITVHRCLHNKAPKYLTDCCVVVSDIAGRQHTITSWMYRAINDQHSAVGRSLSLDQLSGIRFQTSSEMRLRTLLGSHWKHCFSDNISVLSALEVLTTMRNINRHFTYYTYLVS